MTAILELNVKIHQLKLKQQLNGTSTQQLFKCVYLCSDADRASVQVALAHHGAAHHYQGSRAEAHLVCPQHGRYSHITTWQE